MKNINSIDELFREKLQNFEQTPRAGLFDEVLAGIAAERRRRKILFWKITGIAAALLLAFVAGWQFNSRNQDINKTPAFAEQKQIIGDQEITSEPVSEEKTTANPDETDTPLQKINETFAIPEAGNTKNGSRAFAELKNVSKSDSQNKLSFTNGQSGEIVPMKSLFHLIEQRKAENELREKREMEARSQKLIKSIDQQIMEQNQKTYLSKLTTKQRGRWFIGAQVSPAYNLDHGSYSQAYASNMVGASSVNPVDLGGGLSLQYKTGKRLSLQTGVYYDGIGLSSGNSSQSASLDLMASNDALNYFNAPVSIESDKVMMNSSAGVIQMNQIPSNMVLGSSMDDKALSSTVLVSDARFIQNFQYLEIPLYLRYALFDSRFDIEMLGGFSTNVLIGNDAYLQNGSAKSLVGSTQDMRTFNYSGTLGIGFKYGLSKHFYLNVEPRVKYFLNSLNTNSSVKYKPYIFGIYTGVSYEF